MLIDDLPPVPRFILSTAGTLFTMAGAAVQGLGVTISFFIGIGLSWRYPGLQDLVVLAGIFALQLFGAVAQQFGLIVLRNKLPVRQDRLLQWWMYRTLWMWSGITLIPLVIGAVIRLVKLDWGALPLALGAMACVYAGRYFLRREDESILPSGDPSTDS